jgi:hypothetical protein
VLSLAFGQTTPLALSPSADATAVQQLTESSAIPDAKGGAARKNQPVSCTKECVHEEDASYVLVVGNRIYALEGDRDGLDRFAGGPPTIRGRFSGNAFLVNSATTAQE